MVTRLLIIIDTSIIVRADRTAHRALQPIKEERMLPSMFFERVGLMEDSSFRGSIPSLALKPDTFRLPASCRLLPHCMRDLVLGWWLTFTQAGLTPARIDKLAWRTKKWKLQQLQDVISKIPDRNLYQLKASSNKVPSHILVTGPFI